MKRRILCALLALVLCCALALPVFASGETVLEVSTPEELAAMDGQSGTYRLTTNIDLAGIDWVPIDFSGTLDGGGFTVCNMRVTQPGKTGATTIDGNNIAYDTVLCGLFGRLDKAEIFNLTIRGADIDIDSDDSCFIGGLCGYSHNSLLKNITLADSRLHLTAGGINVGIGGIVGFGCGTVVGATVYDSPMVFTDKNADRRCEMFLGGVLSNGNAIIDNCRVDMDGYAACNGYVHSGGLVGMFYQYDSSIDVGSVANSTVSGEIFFYENNPDRRAYCDAYIGEPLTEVYANYCESAFVRNETTQIWQTMAPEKCEEPCYEDTVTVGSCTEWGCTEHTCTGCGYSYKDSFTVPGHTPGKWEFVSAPDYNTPGHEELCCLVCGQILDSRDTPALVPVSEITLSGDMTLSYGEEADIAMAVSPGNAEDRNVTWTSSQPEIVSVDQEGHIAALDRGSAVISCASDDGFAESHVTVTVEFTKKQMILYYVCFGWLWMK